VKNLIIMGAGRSGTSLVAGMLAKAGYNMGDNYLEPNRSNPKGFFEDRTVTAINDGILQDVFPYSLGPKIERLSPRLAHAFYRYVPRPTHLWLAGLGPWRSIPATRRFDPDIERLLVEPYCYKDPRFYFTLPVWRPHLRNIGFVCVFRSPERTAESIVRECAEAPYLAGLKMTRKKALRIWRNSYRWILRHHAGGGDWLFIHFDQALTPGGMDRVEAFAGARLDRSFADRRLSRSRNESSHGGPTYERLCALAGP
jgi:hypothetical protein